MTEIPGGYVDPYAQEAAEQEQEFGIGDYIGDGIRGVTRGIAGAGVGVANLFGADIDNPIDETESALGGFAEGISQFLVGFLPVAGVLGRFGGALSKYNQATKATKGAAKAIEYGRNTVAGAVADFAVFDSNDARLSNLIQDIPGLANPITEFLAADTDEDAGSISGRMKNVIEGAGIGFVADAIVGVFKGIRKHKKGLEEGNEELAQEGLEDAAAAADEGLMRPVDQAEAEEDSLLEGVVDDIPETENARELRELDDPELVPEGEDPDLAERFTLPEAERRMGYDEDGDIVMVTQSQDEEGILRGFTQFDSFVREKDSRLRIIQLKRGAKILHGTSKEAKQLLGRKPRKITKEQHEYNLMMKAKEAGYDAVNYGRGNRQEIVVVNPEAKAREITVKPGEKIWTQRADAQTVKIDSIVKNSRVEAAIHNMRLGEKETVEFAQKFAEAKQSVRMLGEGEQFMEKMAGVINLSKLGGREKRAFYKLFTEEFEMPTDPKKSHAQTVDESARKLAQMTGGDPKVIAKRLDLKADQVNDAASEALAATKFLDIELKNMITLAKQIDDWGVGEAVTDAKGKSLSRGEAAEMLGRQIEDIQSVGMAIGRIRGASGRFLNSFNLGVHDMSKNALARSLELRGGSIDHMMRTAHLIAKDAETAGAHAANLLGSQLVRKAKRGVFTQGATDWYIAGLLSAPKTITTNFLGSLGTAFFRPIESMLGAMVGRKVLDPKIAKGMDRAYNVSTRQIRTLSDSVMQAVGVREMTESGKVVQSSVKRAFKDNEGVLTKQRGWAEEGLDDAVKRKLSDDKDPSSGMGEVLRDIFNRVVAVPSRFMGAGDEFNKQIVVQSHLRAELSEKFAEQRQFFEELAAKDPNYIKPTEESWVDAEMKRLIKNGELRTEAAIRQEAEQRFRPSLFADESNRQAHIKDYIQKETSNEAVEGGEAFFSRSGLVDDALASAREATHTTPLDPVDGDAFHKAGHALQRLTEDIPLLKFFTPFIRTPLNILTFTANRVPVPWLNRDFNSMVATAADKFGLLPERLKGSTDRWMKEIHSSDELKAAQAFGRATTTVGIMGGLFGLSAAGAFTGAGPADIEQKKVLQATGWQPYSIKIGDKYFSYQKMDPFASLIGLTADVVDAHRFGDPDDSLTMGYFAALLETLSSKSYLTGVMDLMKVITDPEHQVEKLGGRLAGNFFVPNIVASARSFSDEHFDEVKTMMERVKSRLPFLNDSVNQQRNLLGEAVNKKTFSGALQAAEGLGNYMLPLQINATGDDVLDNELANLAFPFRPPSYNKWGVDLRDHANDAGQTAYDRMQELTSTTKIGGRGLRSTLKRLIGSNKYQSLDQLPVDKLDLESPRIALITSVVNRFRRQATREMLTEFEELQQHTVDQRIARQGLRAGSSSDDIAALLGGN